MVLKIISMYHAMWWHIHVPVILSWI